MSCTEPDWEDEWDDDADSGMEESTSSFDAEVSYLLLDVEENHIRGGHSGRVQHCVSVTETVYLKLVIDQHYSICRSLQYHWEFYSLYRGDAVLPPEATITWGPLDSHSLRVTPQPIHVSYEKDEDR